jgi:hypothetical protein
LLVSFSHATKCWAFCRRKRVADTYSKERALFIIAIKARE